MARIAMRDTYALEPQGGDNPPIRRVVKAGQLVPDHYEFEDESAVQDAAAGAKNNAAVEAPTVDADEYDGMTGAQLDEELEARGLPKSGTVGEKRDRLREDDAGGGE